MKNQVGTNRIQELDALRGIALFGILLVNIFVFHAPIGYYREFYGAFEGTQATAVNAVVDFASSKFLFIFAFLFGYGIFLQQQSRPKQFNSYFSKRMIVLFLFGLAHILLFWFGDILASYALLGLLLIPLLQLSNRMILGLGLFFILFRPLYFFATVAFDWSLVEMENPAQLEQFIATFQEGTYQDIFSLRMKEFFSFLPENLIWFIPKTFGLFFLGIYAARKKLFARMRKKKGTYLVAAIVFIPSSFFWMHYRLDLFMMVDLETEPIWRPIFISGNVLFETAMGIGYIIGFSMIFQHVNWLCQLLAKAGRLALTNYISQSLICVLIFYGYGLGYYGQLRPTDLILIALLIFAFNVTFSFLYLRFKKVGPLEHLWRKLIGKRAD